MWSKITRLFNRERKSSEESTKNEDIIEEIRNVKKLVRKQKIFQEAFRDDVLKEINRRNRVRMDPVLEFADALFYLGVSLKDTSHVSLEHKQASEIVWHKFESLFSLIGLEVIHRSGIKFDSRLYEAVEKTSEDNNNLTVIKVLQPGYIYKGRIIKPAKAIVGHNKNRNILAF